MTSPIHLVTGSDLEVMFSEVVTELSSIFFLMGKMTLAMFRWNSHIGKEQKQHFFSFNKLRFHFYTLKEAHDGIHRKTSHTGKILLGLDFLMKMHCRAHCWVQGNSFQLFYTQQFQCCSAGVGLRRRAQRTVLSQTARNSRQHLHNTGEITQ